MKSRSSLYLVLAFLLMALGGLWFRTRGELQSPSEVFPAVVNRDCAPWDGGAFTVSITHPSGTVIYLSIWRSPDIPFPTTFSFPDKTGQTGAAYILSEIDPYQPLSGEVWLQGVDEESPVEGRFQFRSETGVRYEGRFVGEWGDEIVYCG